MTRYAVYRIAEYSFSHVLKISFEEELCLDKLEPLAAQALIILCYEGNEQKNLFLDDDDRIYFIDTLLEKKNGQDWSILCHR